MLPLHSTFLFLAALTEQHLDWLLKLIVLAMVAGIGWQIGRLFNDIFAFIQHAWLYLFKRPLTVRPIRQLQSLSVKERQFLFDQLHFYKYLYHAERQVFDHRVIRFMERRQFEAKGDVDLTQEMKLLIAATSVQLTFGLRSYMLKEFERIVIYPDAYYNPKKNQYHKGETQRGGTVVLSWKHFEEGIAIPDDNLNLGIHEFAHTLAFQRLLNPSFTDSFFREAFDKLMRNISNPVFRKRIGERARLRSYALTNPMEFFAVATEVFFETPNDLKVNHPTIYSLFREMYNQDLVEHFGRSVQPIAH